MMFQRFECRFCGGFRFVPTPSLLIAGETLGLLFGGCTALAFLLDFCGQRTVLPLQVFLFGASLLPRLFKLRLFLAERLPGADQFEQSVSLIVAFDFIRRRRRVRRKTRLFLVVLLFLTLDFCLRVASGLHQFFGGIVRFILIEFELRLGYVELVLQISFLRLRSARDFLGQRADLVLIFL